MIVANGSSHWLLLHLLTSFTTSLANKQISSRNQAGNLTGIQARNQVGNWAGNQEGTQVQNQVGNLSGVHVGNQKSNTTFDLTSNHEIYNQVHVNIGCVNLKI